MPSKITWKQLQVTFSEQFIDMAQNIFHAFHVIFKDIPWPASSILSIQEGNVCQMFVTNVTQIFYK